MRRPPELALLVLLFGLTGCGGKGRVALQAAERAAALAAEKAAAVRIAAEAAERAGPAADDIGRGIGRAGAGSGAARAHAGSEEHGLLDELGHEVGHHGPELMRHGVEGLESMRDTSSH